MRFSIVYFISERRYRWTAIFLFLVLGGVSHSQEIEKGGIDDRDAAINFCKQLQQAVKTKQIAEIEHWVNGYPLEIEAAIRVSSPAGTIEQTRTLLISDKKDFFELFNSIFSEDLTRSLLSYSGCELQGGPNGSAKIGNGKIEIDQFENGTKTVIMAISPPKNYPEFYGDNSNYENGAKTFFHELKKAILSDDRPTVAKLCRYPLSVNVGGKNLLLKERSELLSRYPAVFTPKMKEAVMRLSEPIHMDWRGFMTDGGEIWFDLVVGTEYFRVGTINVP